MLWVPAELLFCPGTLIQRLHPQAAFTWCFYIFFRYYLKVISHLHPTGIIFFFFTCSFCFVLNHALNFIIKEAFKNLKSGPCSKQWQAGGPGSWCAHCLVTGEHTVPEAGLGTWAPTLPVAFCSESGLLCLLTLNSRFHLTTSHC